MKDNAARRHWTLLSVLEAAEQYLASRQVESPRRAAELLLSQLLGLKRIDLYVEYDRPVSDQERDRLRELVRRAGNQEPLQYILGKTDWRDLTLAVASGVLIPRPETEGLVDLVLARLEPQLPRTLLDLGTGSGCLAIALARALPETTAVTALDSSPEAIALAERNIAAYKLTERIELVTGSAFDLSVERQWDVIVSNPPYIDIAERETLPPNVREWEPHTALFDGGDGLSFYRLLSEGGLLAPGGSIFCELPAPAATTVQQLFESRFQEVTVEPDLAGRPRYLIASGEREHGHE